MKPVETSYAHQTPARAVVSPGAPVAASVASLTRRGQTKSKVAQCYAGHPEPLTELGRCMMSAVATRVGAWPSHTCGGAVCS